MTSKLLAVEVSANRGMVKLAEAAEPALALNGTGGVGAKLAFTVAVPGGGELLPGLGLNCVHTPKMNVSLVAGLVFMTSQTAVAEPPDCGSSNRPVVAGLPLTPTDGDSAGGKPLASG